LAARSTGSNRPRARKLGTRGWHRRPFAKARCAMEIHDQQSRWCQRRLFVRAQLLEVLRPFGHKGLAGSWMPQGDQRPLYKLDARHERSERQSCRGPSLSIVRRFSARSHGENEGKVHDYTKEDRNQSPQWGEEHRPDVSGGEGRFLQECLEARAARAVHPLPRRGPCRLPGALARAPTGTRNQKAQSKSSSSSGWPSPCGRCGARITLNLS
jgi:hypothetical protein